MRAFTLLAAVGIVAATSACVAAEAVEQPMTKVYSLKHAAGGDVVALLRSLFIDVDQEHAYFRCQFDERTDALVVWACPQHQGQVARAIALVDVREKAAAAGARREESPQAVRGYPVTAAAGEAAVAALRSLFLVVNHRAAYARFGYDARTGLLIVIASERHHPQIAGVLDALEKPNAAAKEARRGPLLRRYPVKHLDGERLVAKLRSQFVVVNHEEAWVRFGFDRRSRSLLVLADAAVQAQVGEAIAVLDQPSEGRGAGTAAPADPEAFLLGDISRYLAEAEGLFKAGRIEEGRQHAEKAATRAEQLQALRRLGTGGSIGGGLSRFPRSENGTVPLQSATVIASPVLGAAESRRAK